MGLTAFTQEPGVLFQMEKKTGMISGATNFNGEKGPNGGLIPFAPYPGESHDVRVAKSVKPHATYGDHKSAYNYRREVRYATVDAPYVYRYYTTNGEPSSSPSYICTNDTNVERYLSYEHGAFGYVPPLPGLQNATDASIVKALNNMRGKNATLGSDVIAEGKESLDQLSSAVVTTARSLLALKRGNFAEFLRALGLDRNSLRRPDKRIGSLWLQYVYGWKPMAQSVYDLQALATEKLSKKDVVTGKGHGRTSSEDSGIYDGRIYTSTSQGSVKTLVAAEVANKNLFFLNKLGVTNPAEIVWEAVPWSFAIDWFVPIGDYLTAASAGLGLTPLGGYTSTQIYDEFSLYKKLDSGLGGVQTPGAYGERGFVFDRHAFTGFPTPHLYANENPFSTPRLLNALALVTQLI